MLEFLVELVVQFVFEVVAELLFEAGFTAAGRVLRFRVVRYGLAVVAGFGFGVWWGDRLSGSHRPYLFWVSLTVAVMAGIGALRRRTDAPGEDSAIAELRRLSDTGPGEVGPRWRMSVDPRRWPTHRLVGLAVLNGAVAAGIAVGFNPIP